MKHKGLKQVDKNTAMHHYTKKYEDKIYYEETIKEFEKYVLDNFKKEDTDYFISNDDTVLIHKDGEIHVLSDRISSSIFYEISNLFMFRYPSISYDITHNDDVMDTFIIYYEKIK